jgi:hypothetical protein
MPSGTYEQIWQAVRGRRQLTFVYNRLPREVCPTIVGYAADGREVLFAYQFAGQTSSRSRLPEWRCFYLAEMRDLAVRTGPWHEGTSHRQAQACVPLVDVDANIPETLKRTAPLPFGSPALRQPRGASNGVR